MSTKRPDWSWRLGSDQAASHSTALAVEHATDGPPGMVASMPFPIMAHAESLVQTEQVSVIRADSANSVVPAAHENTAPPIRLEGDSNFGLQKRSSTVGTVR